MWWPKIHSSVAQQQRLMQLEPMSFVSSILRPAYSGSLGFDGIMILMYQTYPFLDVSQAHCFSFLDTDACIAHGTKFERGKVMPDTVCAGNCRCYKAERTW